MIRVTGDRVLVVLPPKEEVQDEATGFTYQETGTASGLVLAKPADHYNVVTATRGIVVQVGEKSTSVDRAEVIDLLRKGADTSHFAALMALDAAFEAVRALAPAPFDVAVGDCVLFPASAGDSVLIEGVEHVILREEQILAVVEPVEVEEVA